MSIRKAKSEVLEGYAGKIMVDLGLEEVKFVESGKASFWESVPQSSISWEEAVLLMKYKGNGDDSHLCAWHGGSQLWGSGLVKLRNVLCSYHK